MIILAGLCIYFTVTVELITNDSICNVWMKRMIEYTNSAIDKIATYAENSIQISKRKKRRNTQRRTKLWRGALIISVAVAMQAKSAAEERHIF